eukprot:GABV01001166.1.p1 GENE.GABV01001166.1~~GABV01001166.1.p1  ORF type:complete len:182 (-),score=82.31 GABV01001166.1:4-549(-)
MKNSKRASIWRILLNKNVRFSLHGQPTKYSERKDDCFRVFSESLPALPSGAAAVKPRRRAVEPPAAVAAESPAAAVVVSPVSSSAASVDSSKPLANGSPVTIDLPVSFDDAADEPVAAAPAVVAEQQQQQQPVVAEEDEDETNFDMSEVDAMLEGIDDEAGGGADDVDADLDLDLEEDFLS